MLAVARSRGLPMRHRSGPLRTASIKSLALPCLCCLGWAQFGLGRACGIRIQESSLNRAFFTSMCVQCLRSRTHIGSDGDSRHVRTLFQPYEPSYISPRASEVSKLRWIWGSGFFEKRKPTLPYEVPSNSFAPEMWCCLLLRGLHIWLIQSCI